MTMLYETSATATHEGRNGSVRSGDGLLDVRLAMPKDFGGAGGATNPEQLFAAGYAACFTSALLLTAREHKLAIGDPTVTVHAGLERTASGKFGLTARIAVALPEASHADAEAAVAKAHEVCPYSNATRGNVDVKVELVRWKEVADA